MLSLLEELRFWTGIMRDHGEFIATSLSYNEEEAIRYANYYKGVFINLHEKVKNTNPADNAAVSTVTTESLNALQYFVSFKKVLLRRLLECNLSTSLPPTFYNHMINEAMEFYKTIMSRQSTAQMSKLAENLNLHLLWLPDAAGHAATIACDLDPVEKLLIEEAHEFEKRFNYLVIKAQELCKMLARTGLNYGVLEHLNEEAKKTICDFICYLEKIKELNCNCKILRILKPLIPDHMIREENHYLMELTSVR